jgi:hypothetical protein
LKRGLAMPPPLSVGFGALPRNAHSTAALPQIRDEHVSGEDQERGFLTGHAATL